MSPEWPSGIRRPRTADVTRFGSEVLAAEALRTEDRSPSSTGRQRKCTLPPPSLSLQPLYGLRAATHIREDPPLRSPWGSPVHLAQKHSQEPPEHWVTQIFGPLVACSSGHVKSSFRPAKPPRSRSGAQVSPQVPEALRPCCRQKGPCNTHRRVGTGQARPPSASTHACLVRGARSARLCGGVSRGVDAKSLVQCHTAHWC